MKKGILICVLIAGVLVSTGCSGSRVKAPERVFEPEEAFLEIPHSSFEAEWLEGGMKDEDGHVYEEVYDFVLAMDRAVIPYTVSGKLIQTCEYNPSEGSWNVERRTEDVTQEMDLTKYAGSWKMILCTNTRRLSSKPVPIPLRPGSRIIPRVFILQWISCPAARI